MNSESGDNNNKLDEIVELLKSLEKRIIKIENDCSKMEDHINFVEVTYNTLRIPLNFVKRRIDRYIGSSNTIELPIINNPNNNIDE